MFRRDETTPGLDYTVTTAFFRSRPEAERGEYSTARIECDPDAFVTAVWKNEDFLVEAEDGDCEFRGEAHLEWRENLQLK